MAYLMGLDLGTSSVRALLIREDGARLALHGEQYDVDIPRPRHAEQNPETWYRKTIVCIKSVLASSGIAPDDIAALSFSGQMHGLVCLDGDGCVVRPAIIWPDQRSAEEIREIYARLGRDKVARHCQNGIATGFLIASLYWLAKQERETYDRTATVMLPKDYIKYRLCGRATTDYSDAAGSLAFDNVNLRWAREMIEALDLDMAKFPEILPSTAVVGKVSAAAARETGLATTTAVVNGGADQPMQAIGNGIVADGVFSSNIGTGGQISVGMGRPLSDPGLRTSTFAHVLPGRWYVMGAILNCGAALKWLARNILRDADFAALDREAAGIAPLAEGLIFLPYLTGERTPHLDPDARAVFFGLNPGHTRFHMVRAVMEGVAFALRDGMEIITGLGLSCDRLIASGGGAKSPLWLQIQADILGREVYRSLSDEQACLGAAITAGVGVGTYRNFAEACGELVAIDAAPREPNAKNAATYRDGFRLYQRLYDGNRELFRELRSIAEAAPAGERKEPPHA